MPEDTYTKVELDKRFKSMEEKNDAWSATIMKAIENSHKEQMERYDLLDKKIDPMLQVWDGTGLLGRVILSAGKLALSLGAIGAFLVYIINYIRHG